MPAPEFDPRVILAIAQDIKPHLEGLHPATQGAVLAELLSLWLAGHPEEMRDAILDSHVAIVRDLTPINAKILRS